MRAPDFWAGGAATGGGRCLALALAPLGRIYGALTASRASRPPVWKAPVPVICVGNAVMGGAGKTQVCLDLAHRLSAPGRAVHVLSRGYGGKLPGPVKVDPDALGAADVGDEALVLARHAPTWICADRTASARAAVDDGAALLIMDDGFQNPDLGKDVSLLVIDAGFGFGNGRVFPAGPLRETAASAFARTDGVCIIGEADAALPTLPAAIPAFHARIMPDPSPSNLAGRKVIAFAGIGRPEKFFATLRDAGADIVASRSFADHHPFTDGELGGLLKSAEDNDCVVVTTEKDHARLGTAFRDRIMPFPVRLAWDDGDALQRFILERIGLN